MSRDFDVCASRIAETRKASKCELTVGISLGDVWSQRVPSNEDGKVVDRGRCRIISNELNRELNYAERRRIAAARLCRFQFQASKRYCAVVQMIRSATDLLLGRHSGPGSLSPKLVRSSNQACRGLARRERPDPFTQH